MSKGTDYLVVVGINEDYAAASLMSLHDKNNKNPE